MNNHKLATYVMKTTWCTIWIAYR